jgi:hypothetical protein
LALHLWLFLDDGSTDCALAFGCEVDFLAGDFILQPFCGCSWVYLPAFLVQDGDYFVFCLCEAFVLLEGGVEVQLAHLGRAQGYLQQVDDLYQFVHAELCVGQFSFVEGNQDEIVDVFAFVFTGAVGLDFKDRHEFAELFCSQSLHCNNFIMYRGGQ